MACTARRQLKVRLLLCKIVFSAHLTRYVAIHRQYVVWLNNESLEFGGPLVDNFPVEYVAIY